MSSKSTKSGDLSAFLQKMGITTLVKFVRFGGIVGKLSLLGIGAFAVLAIIAWRIDTASLIWLAILALISLLAVVIPVFVFGMKHPEYATLEGSEVVLLHNQTQFGTERKTINLEVFDSLEKAPNKLELKAAEGSKD